MTLEVWTARISSRDPDAFNTTRKSGHPEFAPSWKILGRMLHIRKEEGRDATDEEWRSYAKDYLAEMTRSYRVNRPAWDDLLARKRVVLTCYCTNPSRCHRRILAKILEKLGATDCGEVSNTATASRARSPE